MFNVVSETLQNPTAGDLARLRSCIAGCELVVLADISTKTVLAWDGALKLPQEHLDALCDLASEILTHGPDSASVVSDTAVLAKPTGCRTFVRSPDDPAEVLCSVLAASAEVSAAIEASVAFFAPGSRTDAGTVH